MNHFISKSINRIFLAAMTLLVCFAVQAGSSNLIQNGNFQDGLTGWGTIRGGNGSIEIKGGKWEEYVQLRSQTGNGPIRSVYITRKISPEVIRGRTLQLQAKVKADNIALGAHSYSQGVITLIWKGKDGRDREVSKRFKGTFDWTNINEIWDVSDDCVEATLYLGMHTTTGTISFDDVSLTAAKSKEVKSVKNISPTVKEVIYNDGNISLLVDNQEFRKVNPVVTQTAFSATIAEQQQGFVIFQTEEPTEAISGRIPAREEVIDSLTLTAALDQYEPVFFAIHALRPLNQIRITVGNLKGPGVIPASAFEVRMGQQTIQRIDYGGRQYHIVPKLLVPANPLTILPECPQLYWLTLHVPKNANPGIYRGEITVEANGAAAKKLPVTLNVLPFSLAKENPWMLCYYNSDSYSAEKAFRDMREHGMTSVMLLNPQLQISRKENRAVIDFSGSDTLVQAYKKAGFTDPLVYNPCHDRLATNLLELWGKEKNYREVRRGGYTFRAFNSESYPEDLRAIYQQVIRDIYTHARTAGWPETMLYLSDEPNDPGWQVDAAKMEYRLTKEALPSVSKTSCTLYTVEAMKRLDPWVDVRLCPLQTITESPGHKKVFQDYIKQTRGEIWGIEWPAMWDDFWRAREASGFLPVKAGVPAMTAWTYYISNPSAIQDPYYDLRGGNKKCMLTYQTESGDVIPTVTWEGMRSGITDWRYFVTLRELVEKSTGEKREYGSRILKEIESEIPWRGENRRNWGNQRAAHLREKIIKAILVMLANNK